MSFGLYALQHDEIKRGSYNKDLSCVHHVFVYQCVQKVVSLTNLSVWCWRPGFITCIDRHKGLISFLLSFRRDFLVLFISLLLLSHCCWFRPLFLLLFLLLLLLLYCYCQCPFLWCLFLLFSVLVSFSGVLFPSVSVFHLFIF